MPRTKLSQENYRPISFIMFIKLSVQSLSSIHFSCSVVSNSLWSHESTPGFAMAPARHESVPVVSDSLWSLAARQASLSNTNSRSLLKLLSIKLVMPSNYPILCCPLLFLPSVFPRIRVFSSESVPCIRGPKYWSFSFSINPSNEYPGLISFRMDWLDLPAIQGTINSLLQQHSSKAPILQCSAFFIVQLSHPYMTTGKTIALTRQTCWQNNVSAF